MSDQSRADSGLRVPKQGHELTRRDWMLRLGELVALVGASGLVPDFVTALPQKAQAAAVALPPGLYQPSARHLTHALASTEAIHPIPADSPTDYVQPRTGPFRPQFFSQAEFKVVSRIIEILFGNADSAALAEAAEWLDLRVQSSAAIRQAAQQLDPLHRSLAVAYYGDDRVRELETLDLQGICRTGLPAIEARAREAFGKNFLDLSTSQQVQLLTTAGTAPEQTPLRRFFDLVRTEAIDGYYTSAAGLKELEYTGNAFYPECPGCELTRGASGKS